MSGSFFHITNVGQTTQDLPLDPDTWPRVPVKCSRHSYKARSHLPQSLKSYFCCYSSPSVTGSANTDSSLPEPPRQRAVLSNIILPFPHSSSFFFFYFFLRASPPKCSREELAGPQVARGGHSCLKENQSQMLVRRCPPGFYSTVMVSYGN